MQTIEENSRLDSKQSQGLMLFVLKTIALDSGNFLIFFLAILALAVSQSLFILSFSVLIRFIELFASEQGAVPLVRLLPEFFHKFDLNLTKVILSKDALIFFIPSCVVLIAFLKSSSAILYATTSAKITLLVSKRYRDTLFWKILKKNYVSIKKRSPGSWASTLMNDVNVLQSRLSDLLASMLKDMLLIFVSLTTLLLIQWRVIFLLLLLVPIFCGIVKVIGGRIKYYVSCYQKEMASIIDHLLHLRRRYDLCRVQDGYDREVEEFRGINQNYSRFLRKFLALRSVFAPGLEFMFVLFLVLLSTIIQQEWFQVEYSSLGLLVAVLLSIFRPLRSVIEQITLLHEVLGSLKAGITVIEEEFEPGELPLEEYHASESTVENRHAVDIHRVVCGYGTQELLKARNLHLAPGSMIAVVGSSGSGKSLLVKTLCGLVQPLNYDGSLTFSDLCQRCSYGSQEPFLFDGTLKENILYGSPSVGFESGQSLTRITESACIDYKSQKHFSRGLDTPVDTLKLGVSGGQAQRISLARVFARDKPILLLDEVTSALDPEVENEIVSKLREVVLKSKAVVIFVTHRPALLERFDQIWHVESGVVSVKSS